MADVGALLRRRASDRISVSVPAEPVLLEGSVADELYAAATNALDNVASHAGPKARAYVLLEDLGDWAWRHWRITVELAPGEHEILVRAWDSSAATQPEDEAGLWNPKGYVNNARPRIRIRAAEQVRGKVARP